MKASSKFFTLLVFLGSVVAYAQDSETSFIEGMNVRAIGPAAMSGRVTSIAVSPHDKNLIYIGTASGGLWRSENGGTSWRSIFDDQPTQNIGAVALSPTNPDHIWVGTGEGNPRNSQNSGMGVFRSIDGGRSWDFMGLEESRNIHRIIVHPQNPDVVYLGVQGSAWHDHNERGVYKTTDGGVSWEQILFNNERTGIGDLVMDPANPDKLIAAMWDFRRRPWTFRSGGVGSGIYITYNGGEDWEKLDEEAGIPSDTIGRVGLAISNSNPDIVYALIEAKENALYRSDDGGHSYRKVKKNVGNRPFYYSDIFVDPTNPNILYNLWSRASKSIDGGRSWKVIANYSTVHPDHHALYIDADDPNYIINGNDGGLAITKDGGISWRYVENLPLGQFYHIEIDNEEPYNIYGGLQDNGSWVGPAYTWTNGGITNAQWQEIYFGDGFDVLPDPSDNRYAYAMSQGGSLARIDKSTGSSVYIKPVHPEGLKLRYNWNAGLSKDPHNDQGLYYGSQFLHYSPDHGRNWEILSPDLTTNDPDKQKQAESGGLTLDVTTAENHTTIISIAPSPISDQIIWVGTDDGNVQLTRDRGENWENVKGRMKGLPEFAYICQIHASKRAPEEAFVVANHYRSGDWAPYVFHTTDFGKTWTNIAEDKGLPSYALSFIQDPEVANLMFIGTETGMYYSLDSGGEWELWNHDLPTASISDLKIQERENDLVIGTFGRSIFVIDNIDPLRQLAKGDFKPESDSLRLFHIPDGIHVRSGQSPGVRFAGNSAFFGENRYQRARIPYYVILEEGQKEAKPSFSIRNAEGEEVRQFDQTVNESGFYQVDWSLSRRGVHFPSRKKNTSEQEPRFGFVLPGSYTVIVSHNGLSDTAMINVRMDPRIDHTEEDLIERFEMQDELMGWIDSTYRRTEELHEIMEILSFDRKTFARNQDTTLTDTLAALEKRGKDLEKRIQSVLDTVQMPPSDKQEYVDSEHTLRSKISDAYYASQNSYLAPIQRQRLLVEQAIDAMKSYLEMVDEIISREFGMYREGAEEIEIRRYPDKF
jgi:photosystem II stability/assembly factor-like uncharacterized protein